MVASDDEPFVGGDRRRDPRRMLRVDDSIDRNDYHHADHDFHHHDDDHHDPGGDSGDQHHQSRSSHATDLPRLYP